ncbi:hypothetical protein P8S55_13180 [Halomonas sp. M1]|uniref:hypothetical protein n=1 Tax=Halomonas sp. M1 TaxID=3035470 RepID=UPI0024856ADA|nr:hypothetical protein [Halomonas sp. M1]WFE70729.1 hypothetical protein P8S55_13180 [Halomonas sp. M1]
MTPGAHSNAALALKTQIRDIHVLIEPAEQYGLGAEEPEGYQALLDILDSPSSR